MNGDASSMQQNKKNLNCCLCISYIRKIAKGISFIDEICFASDMVFMST